MKYPPIFQICAADAAVTALIGAAPVRLFMFGLAPQKVQLPYVVWQLVGGGPENYLAGRPVEEDHALQIDVYAGTASAARQIAAAIEHAIETHCYITRYGGESRDPETMNYRSTFDVDWIVKR